MEDGNGALPPRPAMSSLLCEKLPSSGVWGFFRMFLGYFSGEKEVRSQTKRLEITLKPYKHLCPQISLALLKIQKAVMDIKEEK